MDDTVNTEARIQHKSVDAVREISGAIEIVVAVRVECRTRHNDLAVALSHDVSVASFRSRFSGLQVSRVVGQQDVSRREGQHLAIFERFKRHLLRLLLNANVLKNDDASVYCCGSETDG